MRTRTISLCIIVFLLTMVLVSGCQSSTQQAQEIKIGAIFPFSGNMALLGEENWRGAEIARIVRNEKGGIGGKDITFLRADAPDATAAVAEADRLITKEGVKVIIGTYSSSLAYAASEVAERNGVIYWEVGGIADNITERGYKYLFRVCPTASNFGINAARFTANALAPKLGIAPQDLRVAVVYEDSLYGTTVAQYAEEEAKRIGLNVVANEPYSSKSVDLSSVILNLKAADPDVVIATSYAPDSILLSRQSKELGFRPKYLVGTGAGHALRSFAETLGPDAEGVFNTDFTQIRTSSDYAVGIDEFVELYTKTFNEPPRSGHSLVSYHGAMVLFDVLEKAGSVDPEAIREAALAIDQPDDQSPTGYGAKFAGPDAKDAGQNQKAQTAVAQWQNGELITVWPEKAALASIK